MTLNFKRLIMRKLYFLFLLALMASCGEKASESEMTTALDFSYTLDTVMVDAGDGFVFLNRLLATAAFYPDQKTLYNFNPKTIELELIDMEEWKVKERVRMDEEGPLGVGNPRDLAISDDGTFFFLNYFDAHVFDADLAAMKQINITKDNFEGLDEDEVLGHDFVISDTGDQLFVSFGVDDETIPSRGLAIVSLTDQSLKKIPLEIFDRLQDYICTLIIDGEVQMRTAEPVYYHQTGEKVLISSHNYNEIYELDLKTDSLILHTYQSSITQNRKTIPEKKTFSSPAEMMKNFRKMNDEIAFGKLIFDKEKRNFWRVSQELDRMIGDSATFKRVLTLFDEDLQQIHEEELPIDFFSFKFFKDGKLYSHINVDDELGFAVYTFDLN